jgi:hypothetical protein
MICTGIHSGPVTLSIEGRLSPPGSVDLAGWDEVVEVSMAAPVGRVRPAALMADTDPFPEQTAGGPGDNRVRVHARGRDTEIDGVTEVPVEEYHIVAWPAARAPELVHRQTDEYGESMRGSAAKARPVPRPTLDPRRARIEEFLRRVAQEGRG